MTDGVMNGLLLWREITFQYTQVLIATLVLPLFFVKQILGINDSSRVFQYINIQLKFGWVLLGLAIMLGFVHQIWITNIVEEWYKKVDVFDPAVHWVFYGFISCAIFGLILFVVGCLSGIRRNKAS